MEFFYKAYDIRDSTRRGNMVKGVIVNESVYYKLDNLRELVVLTEALGYAQYLG